MSDIIIGLITVKGNNAPQYKTIELIMLLINFLADTATLKRRRGGGGGGFRCTIVFRYKCPKQARS